MLRTCSKLDYVLHDDGAVQATVNTCVRQRRLAVILGVTRRHHVSRWLASRLPLPVLTQMHGEVIHSATPLAPYLATELLLSCTFAAGVPAGPLSPVLQRTQAYPVLTVCRTCTVHTCTALLYDGQSVAHVQMVQ